MEDVLYMDWVPVASPPIIPVTVPVRSGVVNVFSHSEISTTRECHFSFAVRSDGVTLFSFESPQIDESTSKEERIRITADNDFTAKSISEYIRQHVGGAQWFLPKRNKKFLAEDQGLYFSPVRVYSFRSNVFLSTIPESIRHIYSRSRLCEILKNDASVALLRAVRPDGCLSQRFAILKFRENISKKFSEMSTLKSLNKILLTAKMRRKIFQFLAVIAFGLCFLVAYNGIMYIGASILLCTLGIVCGYYFYEVILRRRKSIENLRTLKAQLNYGNIYSMVAERVYGRAQGELKELGVEENSLKILFGHSCVEALPVGAFDSAIGILELVDSSIREKIQLRKEASLLIFAAAALLLLFIK